MGGSAFIQVFDSILGFPKIENFGLNSKKIRAR
jgi:hypothetical protein